MLCTQIASGYRQVEQASYSRDAQVAMDDAADLIELAALVKAAMSKAGVLHRQCSQIRAEDALEQAMGSLEDIAASLGLAATCISDDIRSGEIA